VSVPPGQDCLSLDLLDPDELIDIRMKFEADFLAWLERHEGHLQQLPGPAGAAEVGVLERDLLDVHHPGDSAQVTIKDPGLLGSVLITSHHEKVTADDMIREFEIELLDDYMARALAHRHRAGNME